MERHQLEDRVRASLHARSRDVQPTPELWERVAARTARRARWQLGAWVLSGTAAMIAVVVGGIVLFGQPRSVQIDPEPDVVDTVEEPTATEQATPVPGGSDAPTVITSDGAMLYRVDPATGEVVQELSPFEGFVEGAAIREVAVRPISDEGVLTVATVIEIEGMYDVEVSVFDAEGRRVARQRVGMAGGDATEQPPDVVWSEDGRYLMWAGDSLLDGSVAGPALWAFDWNEQPVDADGIAQTFTVTAPGGAGTLFERGDVVDLRDWRGPSDGQSVVVATTTTGGAYRLDLTHAPSDCGGATPCPPTWDVAVSDLGFEGMSAIDLGTLDNGVDLALVARTGQPGDAEGATLALVADPMSDQQVDLPIPELTSGTAAPGDAWMAIAGDRVAVGFGGQVAHLLTVTGDLVEDLEVTATTALPEGTQAAGLARLGAPLGAPGPSLPTEGPSEGASEHAADAVLLDDGLPAHVVSRYPSADVFLLEDRRTPDEPVATWERPTGVAAGATLLDTIVWPGSTPADVQVVTAWGDGDRTVLARTVVRDGALVANDAFPEDRQPAPGGPGVATPVFDPVGSHLAWVESTADGAQGLRALRWGGADGAPGADLGVVELPDAPPLDRLDDWAATLDRGSVLTARLADVGATRLFEVPLAGTDGPLVVAPEGTQVVELPGVPVAAGSFLFEDGSTRYVAFDDGDRVAYALVDAPDVAVPTGLEGPDAGRVVAFGPDSLLIQHGDGTWDRVQVDDGAASRVEVPGGAVALLPWPDPRA